MSKNKNLDKAIQNLIKNDTDENNFVFLKQLLKSKLYTPVKEYNEDTGKIIFTSVLSQSKEVFLVVFSNVAEIIKTEEFKNQEVIELVYHDLVPIIFNEKSDYDGFVINPFSDSIVVSKDDIIKINNTLAFNKDLNIDMSNESFYFGVPIKYPESELEMIKIYLKNNKKINKAYFTLMQIGLTEAFLFIIDCDENSESIKQEVYNTAKFYFPKDLNIYIVGINEDLGERALKNSKLFYEK